VVHGDGRLQRFGGGAGQADVFGDVAGDAGGGEGEVVTPCVREQAGVVKQGCGVQEFGVDVDSFELADGAGELVRAVAVLEQRFGQDFGGGVCGRAEVT
jgi:hypothetical protein